jgi:hypothetical protein
MQFDKLCVMRIILLFLASVLVTSAPVVSSQADRPFLDELAQRTYAYLSSDWATSNHLPWSWRSPTIEGGGYANTTEIALLLLAHIGAYEMQREWSPDWTATAAEVEAILEQLLAWQSGSQSEGQNGPNAYQNQVFYQWYWINQNPPVVGAGEVDHVVPSIDNAFLAASLIVLRAYGVVNDQPDLTDQADRILGQMDFRLWYDEEKNLFNWGGTDDPLGGHWADYYSNENRIINFVARALGQLSSEEYAASLEALVRRSATYDRDTDYTSDDVTVNHVAWDGSYFTYLAPGIFIREHDTIYGSETIVPATWSQITYAADQGYAAWGLSDCFGIADAGYMQQGALPTAMAGSPETRRGLVAPHASAMALVTPYAELATANLRKLRTQFPASFDARYGFYDCVMTNPRDQQYGDASTRFSALAQGWLFLTIVNAEMQLIQDYFYHDSGVIRAHDEMMRVIE